MHILAFLVLTVWILFLIGLFVFPKDKKKEPEPVVEPIKVATSEDLAMIGLSQQIEQEMYAHQEDRPENIVLVDINGNPIVQETPMPVHDYSPCDSDYCECHFYNPVDIPMIKKKPRKKTAKKVSKKKKIKKKATKRK